MTQKKSFNSKEFRATSPDDFIFNLFKKRTQDLYGCECLYNIVVRVILF